MNVCKAPHGCRYGSLCRTLRRCVGLEAAYIGSLSDLSLCRFLHHQASVLADRTIPEFILSVVHAERRRRSPA